MSAPEDLDLETLEAFAREHLPFVHQLGYAIESFGGGESRIRARYREDDDWK